jgi:hypothetical protein
LRAAIDINECIFKEIICPGWIAVGELSPVAKSQEDNPLFFIVVVGADCNLDAAANEILQYPFNFWQKTVSSPVLPKRPTSRPQSSS